MARVPLHSRQIPIALAAAEVTLTIPRRISRGGDGISALKFRSTGGSATTVVTTAASFEWSDFESGAFATADRFNGLRICNGASFTPILDYDGAGTFTILSGAFTPTPASGQTYWVEADIPNLVSYLMIHATTDEVRFSTFDQAGMIAAGIFSSLPANTSNLLIDNEWGTPGFPIRIASAGAGATTIGLDTFVP